MVQQTTIAPVQYPAPEPDEVAMLVRLQPEVSGVMDACRDRLFDYASCDLATFQVAMKAAREVYGPKGYREDAGACLYNKLASDCGLDEDAPSDPSKNRRYRWGESCAHCFYAMQLARTLMEDICCRLTGLPEDRWPVQQSEIANAETLIARLPADIGRASFVAGNELIRLRDIEAGIQPVGSLIGGVLDEGSASVFYGASGAKKTWIATDIALHVATGRAWRGRPVLGGAVLYVAAEGADGLRRRVAAWKKHYGVDEAPFAILPLAFDLTDKKDVGKLIDHAQRWAASVEHPMTLLIVDTLAKSMGGADENSGGAMTGVAVSVDRIRQETGAHVMLIHHSGRDASRGMRGHTALPAAVDTIVLVEPGLLTIRKQRDGQEGETFPFRLYPVPLGNDASGHAVTSAVVEHMEPTPGATIAAAPETLPALVEAVRSAHALGRPCSA